MRRVKVRYQNTPGAIVTRMGFYNGSGSMKGGYTTSDSCRTTGQLPRLWAERYMKACRDEHTYVVWSYDTPIAWHTIDDEHGHHTWWVPNVKYPVTTTKHVTVVKRAIEREAEHSKLYGFEPARLINDLPRTVRSA
jgi:hypothetical protein